MRIWNADGRAVTVDELLGKAPVLPVISVSRLEDAVPLARALVDAGLPVLELTLRTDIALAAIHAIRHEVRGAVIGAGTVLDANALAAVAEAGAEFAISPGATDALYAAAERASLPWIPAIATASEIMRGLEHGHRRFKFFPAEASGGVGALKSFAGPFPQVRFCPTGGIDAGSAPRYLAMPNVITLGGSWMIPGPLLAARDWTQIGALARAAAGLRAG
jgi:2-dehydro-3-deoxyphosphogluconate aldolase / (4S)-4-hydroxy-2-oxoglutarate aldolase